MTTKGPARIKLEEYYRGAREETLALSADDWEVKAELLSTVASALMLQAPLVEEYLGAQSKSGPAIRAAFLKTASSMNEKSGLLRHGGDALAQVSQKMVTGRGVLDGMANLEQPPPYTPPTYSPGIQPTDAQIKADGESRAASNAQHEQFGDQFQAQEAQAAAWTKKLDDAYLDAIPPMQAIHGQPDPTEPPPTGPGGNQFPPARTPFNPTDTPEKPPHPGPTWEPPVVIKHPEPPEPPVCWPPMPPINHPPVIEPPITHPPTTNHPHPPTYVPGHPGDVTTVGGQTQSGIGGLSSTTAGTPHGSVSGSSTGSSSAALGGLTAGAGGALGGALRSGSLRGTGSAAQVRPVGSTSRSGSAGTLGRSTAAGGTRG
ncbi:MAG: hypothetical protein H0X12_07520, partial [Nocardioides sp.]|nr:hypothetical protein [Nocardioides sp.]